MDPYETIRMRLYDLVSYFPIYTYFVLPILYGQNCMDCPFPNLYNPIWPLNCTTLISALSGRLSHCNFSLLVWENTFHLALITNPRLPAWDFHNLKTSFVSHVLPLTSLENNPFLNSKSTLDLENVSLPLLRSPFITLQYANTMTSIPWAF